MDIDDHVDPPLPRRRRDRLEPGEVSLVVDSGDRLVGFPHEDHPDHVEPEVGHAVEVGGAGARLEWGHLGVAREVHAPEDDHSTERVNEVTAFGTEQGREGDA